MTQFTDLGLAAPIIKALADKGYTSPTPIQEKAIPGVMAGRDLLGIAQTGTGKTAAFALPILHRLAADRRKAPRRGCRCLVLSPTRELATQIAESFRAYGAELGFSVATIFGGVAHGPQIKQLAQGVDIIVAAPGRLLDHLAEKNANLSELEIFVLDEADQMLDMGFIVPIRKVIKHLPKVRQNLFFSATMPNDIGKLADELLKDPVQVSVAPQATTAERVNQQVVFVEAARKRGLLVELFARPDFKRVLVFTRTKRGADKVARILEGAGVQASAIHGNKSQPQREKALAAFKAGDVRALVATDIAARGIDISSVTHVVQYELPDVAEQYVHRIGRTARAGKDGSAVAFCADDERSLLRDIEKVTRQKIPSADRRNDAGLAALTASSPEAKAESHGDPGQRRHDPRQDPRRRRPEPRRPEGKSASRNGDQRRPERSTEQRNEPRVAQSPGADRKPLPKDDTAAKPKRIRRGKRGGAPNWGNADPRTETRGGNAPRGENPNGGQRDGQRNGGQGAKPQGQGQGRRDGRNGGGQNNGERPAGGGKPADRNRKPQQPNKPRNDVLRGSGAAASGPAMSATDLMKFLSQGK